MMIRQLALAITVALLTLSSNARAADDPAAASTGPTELQEVVVTAQKRAEPLQSVPIAISAVTGSELQERGAGNINELTALVPGLTAENFNGLVLPFLRGVGNTGTTAGNESSVGAYVDGVYYARLPANFFDLANIDRVEVLKGPQGTLFGRNTTGGVINVVTSTPSFEPTAFGTLSYGNFDAYALSAYGSTPLGDKTALGLSISGKTDDGFGRNLNTGGRYGYVDSGIARTKLLVEPADGTRLVLSGYVSTSTQSIPKHPYPGTTVADLSNPNIVYTSNDIGFYNSRENINAFDRFDVWGVTARLDQEFPFADFASISAYYHMHENTQVGNVDSLADSGRANLQGPLDQGTQEFQLLSKPGSRVQWILGTYYYYNKTAYDGVPTLIGSIYGPGLILTGEQIARSYAGFGQATVQVAPRLKLTGGLRYTRDQIAANGFYGLATSPPTSLGYTPPGQATVDKPTYRLVADYQFLDDVMGYASYNHAFKSGNFNLLAYTSDTPTRPEEIDAYEVGEKAELLNRRVRLNSAVFYYKIKNPQVQLEREDTVFFSNAGASMVKGAELELQAVVSRGFNGRASVSYLDSKYTDYQDAPASEPDLVHGGAIALPPIDAAGHTTPLASKWTGDVGFDWALGTTRAGGFFLTADYYYNSGYYFEPDNLLHQGAFSVVNAQIRCDLNDHLSVRLWGKNLNDAQYAVAASTVGGAIGYQWMPAPPRTFGIALDYKR
jgi:iron complex outermembrane recepter protein